MTRVSVALATWNGARFITPQLESILGQLVANDEVLIADDGSTDDTLDLISRAGDKRVRIVATARVGHPAYSVERALAAASGDIVLLADQDDVWLPGKVARMRALLATSDLVVGDAEVIDADGRVLAPSFFKAHGSRSGFVRNLVHNAFVGCCMGFTRAIRDLALPLPAKVTMHDQWIGLLATRRARVAFDPVPHIRYRRHPAAHSTTFAPTRFTLPERLTMGTRLLVDIERRLRARGDR